MSGALAKRRLLLIIIIMKLRGAAAAESRYKKLRVTIDEDLFNQDWCEVDIRQPSDISAPIDFIDLFSGAGGISCGLRLAGFRKRFSNEIDPDASATIRRNHPDSAHFEGPIEELDLGRDYPEVLRGPLPLLIGGPPCQGFSVAGYRRPDDPRNRMVEHFLRIVRQTRPWFVVIENVPGILTLSDGKFRQAVFATLESMGYKVSVRILEAAEYGVPQMRSRAIFIANRAGLTNPYPKATRSRDEFVPIEAAIADLEGMPPNPEINHEWTKHSKEFEQRIAAVAPGGSLYETFRDAFKRQHLGVPSMTVKENHGGTHIHPRLNRVISAREMARLQSFPDDYIFSGRMKRVMWQVGNAVPPRLAQAIGLALRPTLLGLQREGFN